MRTARRLIALAMLGCAAPRTPARAEVSAQTDLSGNYVRTVVFSNSSVRNLRIWSVSRMKVGFSPLNPRGDAAGDLWPFVAESPTPQRWPWVVWSHFNGSDYDLVYSRWTGSSWSPTSAVEPAGNPDSALVPHVAYDSGARPHMVWLSVRDDGSSKVMLSIFLSTEWMAPFTVSDPAEAPTNPDVTVLPDGRIQVSYDVGNLRVTRTVVFLRPRTITDDITPFNALTVTAMSSMPFGP